MGKTKSATFACGAWPDQNDDIPYPWKLRAGGYLGLSASSHGSAASLAAYPELDFVIGTDTGGSVRNPAERAGVYGLRSSWGVIDVTGVITSAKTLDAVGFMMRDLVLAHKIAHLWYWLTNTMLTTGNFSYPKKIVYPVEWFPVNSTLAQRLIDSWLTNVTLALGMSIEFQSTSAIFQKVIGYNATMGDWTTNVSSVSIYDNWYAPRMGKQFVHDYGAAFGGRYPELDVSARTPWAESPTYTKDDYDANVKKSWDFTDSWNEHVVVGNKETCSDGFWIYQIADTSSGVPEYRDRTLDVSSYSSLDSFHVSDIRVHILSLFKGSILAYRYFQAFDGCISLPSSWRMGIDDNLFKNVRRVTSLEVLKYPGSICGWDPWLAHSLLHSESTNRVFPDIILSMSLLFT